MYSIHLFANLSLIIWLIISYYLFVYVWWHVHDLFLALGSLNILLNQNVFHDKMMMIPERRPIAAWMTGISIYVYFKVKIGTVQIYIYIYIYTLL